jgi:hypothetical protein
VGVRTGVNVDVGAGVNVDVRVAVIIEVLVAVTEVGIDSVPQPATSKEAVIKIIMNPMYFIVFPASRKPLM